jgi:DNA-binding response OmpR family regulator
VAEKNADERPGVLLVDDDATLRRLLKTTLRAAPVRLFEADNALDALNMARKEHPRVAVLDIGLGQEDGVRLCQSLKTSEATRDVRVLMLSGHADATTRARARRAGAEAFLAKPFSPLALWRTVEQLLAG